MTLYRLLHIQEERRMDGGAVMAFWVVTCGRVDL
jgi:hypothetical protein